MAKPRDVIGERKTVRSGPLDRNGVNELIAHLVNDFLPQLIFEDFDFRFRN